MLLNLSSFSSSVGGTPVPEEKLTLRSTSPLYFSRTPYFYLQKAHRLLNATNPKDEHSKRLSQTNVQPFRDYSEDFELNRGPKSQKTATRTPNAIEAKNRFLRGKSGFTEALNRSKFQIPARKQVETRNETQGSPRRSHSGKLVSFKDVVDKLNSEAKTASKASKESSPIHSNSPRVGPRGDNTPRGATTSNKPRANGARTHAERMRTLFRKSNTVRYSPIRTTFKSEMTTPMLGNVIRRKSCHCSDCGGMSDFEKRHMNIAIAPARSYKYQEENSVSSSKSTGLGLVKSPSYKFDSSPTKNPNEEEDFFSILDAKPMASSPVFINLSKQKGHRKSPEGQCESNSKENKDKIRIVRKKVTKVEKRADITDRKKVSSSPTHKDKMSLHVKEKIVYNLTAREDITPFTMGVHKKAISPSRGTGALSSRDSSVGRRCIERENNDNLACFMELKQELDSESTQSLSTRSKPISNKAAATKEKEKCQEFLPKLNDPVKLANFYFNIVKAPKVKKLDPKVPTVIRDKGIKSTYKIGDNITASLNNIITGAMSSHLKSRPNNQPSSNHNFTDYMLPTQSARDYSGEKGIYRLKERPDDPYSMVSLSFQSPTAARTNFQDKQKIEEQKATKTETTSPRPLIGFKVKPGIVVSPPALSDRSHKSKTPVPRQRSRGIAEGNGKSDTQMHSPEVLGAEKLMKAYVAMGNRSSVKKQRGRVEQ